MAFLNTLTPTKPFSLPSSPSLLIHSMLVRLFRSPIHRLLPIKTRILPNPTTSFFPHPTRSIHTRTVLAMAEGSHTHKHTNRLAAEHSPYLLQHAHNPVDWYPWGEEAFEKAHRKDIPIFLSIGYSTCHWCHVMEVESFENEEVAKMLNDWFVSIKVDREERPDVDKLTRSYDEEYGGFGSAPKFPRPVEIQLMLYQTKKLEENGEKSEANRSLKMVCFTLQCMARGGIHDHIGGGFHRYSVDECWHVPHFEKMLYDQGQLANAYLDAFCIIKDSFYSSVARDILDYLRRDMIGAQGEIYSAEDADSAEFEGASRKKEGAFYVWTISEVEDIVGDAANIFKDHYYIKPSGNCNLSTMSDPHNEFKGKNVLIERKDVSTMASQLGMSIDEYSALLGACRQKLFNKRLNRPRPHLDDKVIVSWNGLAISSFARASQILRTEAEGTKLNFPVVGCDPKEYLEVAEKAASFIESRLYEKHTGRLHHSFRNGPSKAPGFLDDYAFLISGLLDLYEFGGGTHWLSWAIELQATQDKLFLDGDGGGYFNTPGEDPSVLLRVKEDHDGAEPSGNSVSAINLIRLSSMVAGNLSSYYSETAEHLLAVFASRLKDQPVAVPLMCCAADMLSAPRKQVVLVGHKPSEEFDDMVVAAHASYDTNKTVIQIDPNNIEEMEFWETHNQNIALMAKGSPAGKVVAHVCQNFTCSAPVADPKSLEASLKKPVTAYTK
ncbi:uncharacterized protein LOC131231317 isoform X2 [Magnolia sinica]|uniref:uncharacterized protein LOC131231317 isoform X2 n=1 Tax=Magnolia sinica TaxID=86752 RepID=UPI00265B60E6|nr:uncharacterized protein LOC131231317 isoform X2 [Magnolia sinica]